MATARTRWGWLMAGLVLGAAQTGWADDPETRAPVEVLRLRATADVGLSDAGPRERGVSAGKSPQWKLRNTQDIALVRFDAREVLGREVLGATLRLHREGPDRLRYVRLSTVNRDWIEGHATQPGAEAGGATFLHADAAPDAMRPWAFSGSTVADVIMTSGHSIDCWAPHKQIDGDWITIPVTPELVYAMAVGDSDGLAVMEGGTPANHETVFSSVQSPGREPCLEIRLGGVLEHAPETPSVRIEPAPDRAHLKTGALRLVIEPAEDVFCHRVFVDGQLVPRWRVKRPAPNAPTVFCLEDLPPDMDCDVQVVAVGRGGQSSPPARLRARSSGMLTRNVSLGRIQPLVPTEAAPREAGPIAVWPLPGLVKVHPLTGLASSGDLGNVPSRTPAAGQTNAVWDGNRIRLFGCRGEYVSFQLSLENRSPERLGAVYVRPRPLVGHGGNAMIPADHFELSALWYARNRLGEWQPAYCIPFDANAPLSIPLAPARLPEQRHQAVHVDLYIPSDAPAGTYLGSVATSVAGQHEVEIPVAVDVVDLTLPDRLCFWPELGAPKIPDRAIDYYRLAQQHRCVFNPWAWRPSLTGRGAQTQVDWTGYDRQVGPLLTGEAFAGSRRAGVPVECMTLPLEDSWPAPLTPETYKYPGYWPTQGDDPSRIVEHYLQSPPIEKGLTDEYKAAFAAVQRQFVDHFREKGYAQTQMQCFFGGKVSNRIQFGTNVWWTTDEPCFLSDWLALQFFTQLWSSGRGQADPRLWAARADVSRPQWQGLMLAGRADVVYYGAGGQADAAMIRRCRWLTQETGVQVRAYGSLAHEALSTLENIVLLVDAWCDGAHAFAAWQTLGTDPALDRNDAGTEGGVALMVPGDRFGIGPVADIRLKALRDGQQLIEYLALLQRQRKLTREEIKAIVHEATRPQDQAQRGEPIEDADAIEFTSFTAWQVAELRRRILEALLDGQNPAVAQRPGASPPAERVTR
jgi:hypothetical protein